MDNRNDYDSLQEKMSTKPTSIAESLEEAAIKYAKLQGFTDDMDLDYQQEAFIAGANHQKEVDKAKQQWISPKERLPNYGETVLCVVFDGGRDIDVVKPLVRLTHKKDTDFWDYNNSDWHSFGMVTHWMPLPEGPKI